jgi:hypothetical protein
MAKEAEAQSLSRFEEDEMNASVRISKACTCSALLFHSRTRPMDDTLKSPYHLK